MRRAMSLVVISLFAACAAAPESGEAQPRGYETTGDVRELRPERRSVTLHHAAVPGYMPEMTMPFDVADLGLLEGLSVGDRVAVRFTAEPGGRHVIRQLRRLR